MQESAPQGASRYRLALADPGVHSNARIFRDPAPCRPQAATGAPGPAPAGPSSPQRVMPADSSRRSQFRPHLHRRQLAKRVQLVEGAVATLDHPWNDIVAPVTDGELEHVEDVCRCEHRRPLMADQDKDFRP